MSYVKSHWGAYETVKFLKKKQRMIKKSCRLAPKVLEDLMSCLCAKLTVGATAETSIREAGC